MSKKVFFLIILLFIQLGFFPHPVSAVTSCKDSRIDWTPRIFTKEGETQYVMNFTIQDTNTLETLKRSGSYVRLLADQGIFGGGTYTNPPVKVEGSKFPLVLTGNLATRNVHNGVLQWSTAEGGDYTDFCSDVVYQIGAVGQCRISSIPEKIAPDSQVPVKFIGIANTNYRLKITNLNTPGTASYFETTTGSGGQGEFIPLTLNGANGDTFRLEIRPINVTTIDPDRASCRTSFKLDVTASLAPVPSGPVAPVPAKPIAKHCKDKNDHTPLTPDETICTSAGGPETQCGTTAEPGIKTAIGCINTDPTEFIKDFLRFILGISGGLAFLLMLLGAFQMLTSAGNPETLSAGRDRLQSAIIGLLFIIFSVLLLRIIGVDILGLGKQFGL